MSNIARDKRIITILVIFTIIFTFFGATLAYWNWQTTEGQRTGVEFTLTQDFSCAVDGGQDINQTLINIAPTTCTNSTHAIMREVTVIPTIFRNNLSIYMDLWIEVKSLDDGLKNSNNFKYAFTTSNTSCETDVIATGNLKGLTTGSQVPILGKSFDSSEPETYYLWIWLDKEETSPDTMDQSFSLSLGGECTDTPSANHPVLDDGMIPVTISNNGTVKTVSKDSPSWYNYENKEWANVVLVKENGTKTRTYYKNNTGQTVNQDDILAYYVWIPRYSYRIPEYEKELTKCSELVKGTEYEIFEYPECYKIILDNPDDKTILANILYDAAKEEFPDYTETQAQIDVENALQTGVVEMNEILLGFTIELIMQINETMGYNIIFTFEYAPSNELRQPIILENSPREIDIRFESKDTSKSMGNAVNTYRTHPAFTFGEEEISGIWVGKFETSANTDSTCYTSELEGNCLYTNVSPRIVPNVKSLDDQNVSNQFQTSLKFAGGTLSNGVVTFSNDNEYGLKETTDSHMMKNSEWGAVAYLSHSKYGINEEIYMNDSIDYYTGRSAGSVGNDGMSYFGTYTWIGQTINDNGIFGIITDATLGTKASTTGNVTGIYDMSGGAEESVMGVLSDSNGNPRSEYSGFNGMKYGDKMYESYTSGINFPPSKYYDLYLQSQFSGNAGENSSLCTLETCGGHALHETFEWYGDFSLFVEPEAPWFHRGNSAANEFVSGIFSLSNSKSNTSSAWRSILAVGDGT